ncbi:hypothetical protein [Nostoc sp. UCD121]|uniref:hypothetical protein n=1 Tax=Nostoc sp. UCD121 TaxID=2681305 RepID=UPI00162851D1|nr:hypothetical protein [Nostoc sp. UCD121]MBC1221336.1 hypothetical protein [Nostoc sp. UCD120]
MTNNKHIRSSLLNLVLLDPDAAQAFPNDAAVNGALMPSVSNPILWCSRQNRNCQ